MTYDGPERRWTPDFLSVGGVMLPYASRTKVFQTIDRSFHDRSQIRVAFCNAHTMTSALKSRDYASILEDFLVLNDGLGVDMASSLFSGHGFTDNLNGTDFVPYLLEHSSVDLRVFLLGARRDVVEKTARRIEERYPRHRVAGFHDGYFGVGDEAAIVGEINRSGADLLLVAMGNPKQEEFIARNAERLSPRVLIGVGALFDFMAGRVTRAPQIVRKLRLEWLFRMLQEPTRLGWRYTGGIAVFLGQILYHKLAELRLDPTERDRRSGMRQRLRPDYNARQS